MKVPTFVTKTWKASAEALAHSESLGLYDGADEGRDEALGFGV
jgi:hypothetical protein